MNFKNITRLFLLAGLAVGIGFAVSYREFLTSGELEVYMESLGIWAPLAFIFLYLIAPVLFLPGSPITLASGVLFGPLLGTLYSLIGATGGAGIAFLLARYVAGDFAEQKAVGVLGRLKTGVEKEGWRFVAFVRLVPLFPFNVLNYALGLTKIPFKTFMLTSFVTMAPGTAGYAYLGYASREALVGAEDWVSKGLIGLAVLATLVLLPSMVMRGRGAKTLSPEEVQQKMKQKKTGLTVLDVRTAKEYAEGRIAPSAHIPIEELAGRAEELAAKRDRPLVVVCRTERRSRMAARVLNRAGFTEVYVMQGGLTQWAGEGRPVKV